MEDGKESKHVSDCALNITVNSAQNDGWLNVRKVVLPNSTLPGRVC